MMVKGRWPRSKNTDDRENGEAEPLLEKDRVSESGDYRRWLRLAAQAGQQAKTVEERNSDHCREQQDLQSQ